MDHNALNRAVDNILKPGGPSSKESVSNEPFLQRLPIQRQKTGWAMAHLAHPLATALPKASHNGFGIGQI